MTHWDLPGPRGWALALDTDVSERHCAIVVCPSAERPHGLVEAFYRRIDEKRYGPEVRSLDPCGAPDFVAGAPDIDGLAIAAADQLGIHREAGVAYGARELIDEIELEDAIIFVDARGRDAKHQRSWASFTRSVALAGKERAVHDRVPMVVLVDAACVPQLPSPDVNLTLHWWWGAVGPVDAVTALQGHRTALGRVRTAELVELARWDLELVDVLSFEWDGLAKSAAAIALDCVQPIDSGRQDALISSIGRAAGTTPIRVVDAWAAGLVESWEGQLDAHLAVSGDAEGRSWVGQLTIVFPVLERLRMELVEKIAEAADRGSARPIELPDNFVELELGPLRNWQSTNFRGLDRRIRDLLIRAREARNCLAHRTPLQPEQVAALVRAAHDAGMRTTL